MAETIVSPGVLAIENDQSFITQQPITAGAAIIGPTVKGKVGIPTIVTTYSQYQNKYGDTFLSGSNTYTYFTSISAYNYFNNGGTSLLVTRVVGEDFSPANSSIIPIPTAATSASANIDLTYISASVESVGSSSFEVNGITFYFTGSTVANTTNTIYFNTSSFTDSTVADYITTSSAVFNVSSSTTNYSSSLQYILSSTSASNLVLTYTGSNGLTGNSQYYISGSTTTYFTGGTNAAFLSFIPTSTAATSASANIDLTYISASVESVGSSSFGVNGITFYFTGSTVANTTNTIYFNTSSFTDSTVADYITTSSAVFNVSSSTTNYSSSLQYILSSTSSPNLVLTYTGSNGLTGNNQYYTSGSTTTFFTGGTNTELFVLETLSEGEIMNSSGSLYNNGTLENGTTENLRWQISAIDVNTGTFTLIIRQGNDSANSPSVLESWSNLSLDPFSPNYIEKAIGNQSETVASDDGEYYIQLSGDYPNLSSYVRIKQVNFTTPHYLDNTGNPKPQYLGYLPTTSSGVFGGAEGKNVPTGVIANYYENIISENNIQGIPASAYIESISLLANKDAFNYNVLIAPGLLSDIGGVAYTAINNMINTAQNRGDMMVVFDSSKHSSQISTVLNNTAGYDTSYAATYWPWVKTIDPSTANQVWVPASTMIPGVYAFNDNVAAPWFAPAGINRGILATSTQAERVLTQGNRDTLYQSNVNPISTFPNVGVVIFGQKTLQRKSSSLDRINVRRLLIELKGYISQIADTFVFEQNDTVTRNDFLSSINPYLNSVQQQQGLTAFRVIMDETNNPPNVVDNNQLVGQIYLQPTRTAEFILLDFNILPTGATFPS
jgi:hypothetical protein